MTAPTASATVRPSKNQEAQRFYPQLDGLRVFAVTFVLMRHLDDVRLPVAFLLWVILHCATAPVLPVYRRAAHRFAHSSYTLYLVHLPMLIFLKAVLHVPRTTPSGHAFLVGAGIMTAILLYAQLVYEFFEKKTDRVRNWIRPIFAKRQPV